MPSSEMCLQRASYQTMANGTITVQLQKISNHNAAARLHVACRKGTFY